MAGDFPDIPFVQAAGDGGVRAQTQMVVIHATDNTASDEAEASYATHRPDQISAHIYNDEDSVIQAVPLSHVAYGCYPIGNSRSVQFELVGLSNRLTDATLRRIAPIVRRVCDRYGIPIRHVGPAELRAGVRGICGHGDVTLAWGQGSHTDPGPAFPWGTFIGYVNGSATTEEDMDFNQAAKLDALFNAADTVKLDTGKGIVVFPVPFTAALKANSARLDALLAAVAKIGTSNPDVAAIVAQVGEEIAASEARIKAAARDAVGDGLEGGVTQVRAGA